MDQVYDGSGSDSSAISSASEGSGISQGSARSKESAKSKGSARPKKGGEKKVEDIGIRERYGNKAELFRNQESMKPGSHVMIEISDDEGEAEWDEEEVEKTNQENKDNGRKRLEEENEDRNEEKNNEFEGSRKGSSSGVVPLSTMKPIQKKVENIRKSDGRKSTVGTC